MKLMGDSLSVKKLNATNHEAYGGQARLLSEPKNRKPGKNGRPSETKEMVYTWLRKFCARC